MIIYFVFSSVSVVTVFEAVVSLADSVKWDANEEEEALVFEVLVFGKKLKREKEFWFPLRTAASASLKKI